MYNVNYYTYLSVLMNVQKQVSEIVAALKEATLGYF